jgi:hypothetical protein
MRDDGLPTLPTGEPVLARWFVLTMLALVPIALGATLWALSFAGREVVPAAERRAAGGPEVTVARGIAELGTDGTTEPGPGCAEGLTMVGDEGARAALRRALGATCQLLGRGDLGAASLGLDVSSEGDARVRFATFELAGVESSARLEDGVVVLELNARFAFEDATRAAPELIHQLALVSQPDWPGATITAERALAAAREQATACERLSLPAGEPRGCSDVRELLAEPDPLAALAAAGYAS